MNDWTLIRKNLFRKKLRAILLIVSIFIAFLIFGVLVAFLNAFNAGDTDAAKNRLVVSNKINFTQPLPYAYFTKIKSMKGVSIVSHANWFGGYYREPRNQFGMFAIEPESYLTIYPEIVLTDEAKRCFLTERTGLIIGRQAAERYGWKVGQQVPISSNIYTNKRGGQTWDFKICGIFRSPDGKGNEQGLYFNYDYFNESVTFGQDSVGFVSLTTQSEAANDAVAKRIDTLFANSADETVTQTEAAFNKAFVAQLGNIAQIVGLVVGAAFATILMIVGNTMVMAIRERTREIGVLKTLGFPSQRILKHVLCESTALALLGGLAGMLVASFAVAALNTVLSGGFPALSMSPLLWAQAIGIMLLLGLVTGIIPAMNAMRLNILTALGRQ
ncbi:ABC transporter permease [Hankyongella ginsenosidimutans]|uniref:ABC transporter permease n=1 Tax=Hankyongella ginsenosidimutans TaxID=1763828 RepID=A0A4D7BXZ2_9SPHN|nr:ABC transporter permease [Hankyongella ginsenosidimutans]QCI80239.1 ABC transporter permease [Hankyongella ginsenosidimutans]